MTMMSPILKLFLKRENARQRLREKMQWKRVIGVTRRKNPKSPRKQVVSLK
jgi:hypothetical protein